MEKDILVVYHAECLDGLGAAAVAYKKFGENAEYIPVKYTDPVPDMTGKQVYILDFCYDPEVLLPLLHIARKVVVLDHHLKAVNNWRFHMNTASYPTLEMVLNMNSSGAMLAWEYFFPMCQPPALVQHIKDNDLWEFRYPSTKPFITHLKSLRNNIRNWQGLFDLDAKDYAAHIRSGEAMHKLFEGQLNELLSTTERLSVRINGVEGTAINVSPTFTSEAGNFLAKENGTFALVYSIQGDMVRCSLRSSKGSNCNVNDLAGVFGGGGHENSSGFVVSIKKFFTEVLPWK
jgi:nanoRNase/pAp phosphatase (c-di-AMP/oligoRNAs hydrolase)